MSLQIIRPNRSESKKSNGAFRYKAVELDIPLWDPKVLDRLRKEQNPGRYGPRDAQIPLYIPEIDNEGPTPTPTPHEPPSNRGVVYIN